MRILNLTKLAMKQLWRHPVRSLLTILGVSTGMFLYASVESMQDSMKVATEVTSKDNMLVVYRENRFCPFTSRLPESYSRRIENIPGVTEVIPIKVVVSNCGASLDVVTFRGIPTEKVDLLRNDFTFLSGKLEDWKRRSDAAIIGDALATRRSLKVGDKFAAAGITVTVAAIISSEDPQHRNSAYVHLDFVQQVSGSGLGSVTQFNVRVDNSSRMTEISAQIDKDFKVDQAPTTTRPEKAFVAKTVGNLLKLISFTRYVGLAAVLAVAGLVSNTILLTVRGHVKENAIMQTVGFGDLAISYLVIIEGVILGLIGGILGIVSASLLINYGGFCLSGEGLSIVFQTAPHVIISGLIISLLIGLFAGIIPAWKASHQKIVNSLRMEG